MGVFTIFLFIKRVSILSIFINKMMFGFIKKMFLRLLTGIVSTSNNIKCVSLSNQRCMTKPTLINLHLKEYSQNYIFFTEFTS